MKFKKNYTISIILLLSVFIMSGSITFGANAKTNNPGEETRIVIFHVNDMHAQIDRFAKIAWYVEQERKQTPNVFFLDAGDNFTGNPIADQYKPKGEPVRQLLYKMGIDVLTLGNHEFDFGQELLKNFIDEANFKVVSSNMKMESAVLPQPEPFTFLKTKNGITLAILGMIQVEKETGMPSSHPDNLKGITFLNPIENALKYAYLKEKSDVFIALTHIGADEDEILAKKMSQLDLIVGGHSHTIIKDPILVNGVLITQAGSNAKYLGMIELIVKNGKVIRKSGKLIDVASIGTNPEMEGMIKKFNDNPELEKVITTLPRPIKGKLELGNMTTDAIRILFNLDAAFHNNGGLRIDELKQTVKLRDIFSLHPFSNYIVQFEMTPEEIRSLIAYDYEKNNGLDLKVSGIQYTVTATPNHIVKSIELKDKNGQLLDETKTYKVGMNDYISSSYKFNHKDPGKSLMLTAAEVMIRCIEEGKNIIEGIENARTFENIVNEDNK